MMIDLPGFAESDRKELSEEPERDWARALQEVFDSELGEAFWLAGHSFGGYLATLMSLEPKSSHGLACWRHLYCAYARRESMGPRRHNRRR